MKKVFIPKKISAVDNPNVFQWDYLDQYCVKLIFNRL